MLPKSQRLVLRQEKAFFQRAKRTFFPGFGFYFLPGEKVAISVVVPKKVSNKSTVRNALKRQVYQELSPTLSGLQPIKLVIYLQKILTPEDLQRIVREIHKLFQK
jgi:ribonuclease P protein component